MVFVQHQRQIFPNNLTLQTTLGLSFFRKSEDFSILLELIKPVQLIYLIEETILVQWENTWVCSQT